MATDYFNGSGPPEIVQVKSESTPNHQSINDRTNDIAQVAPTPPNCEGHKRGNCRPMIIRLS